MRFLKRTVVVWMFAAALGCIPGFAQESPYFLEDFSGFTQTALTAATDAEVKALLGEAWEAGDAEFEFAIRDDAELDFDKGLLLYGQTLTGSQALRRSLNQSVTTGRHKVVTSFYCYLAAEGSVGARNGLQLHGGTGDALLELYTTNYSTSGLQLAVGDEVRSVYNRRVDGAYYDVEIICDLDSATVDIQISWEGVGSESHVAEGFSLYNDYQNGIAVVTNNAPIAVPQMRSMDGITLYQTCNLSADGTTVKARYGFFDYLGFLPAGEEPSAVIEQYVVENASVYRADNGGIGAAVRLRPDEGEEARFVLSAFYRDDLLLAMDSAVIDAADTDPKELFIEGNGLNLAAGGTLRLFVWKTGMMPVEVYRQEVLGDLGSDPEPMPGARHFDFSAYLPDGAVVQEKLETMKNQHPRLLFSAEEWQSVKAEFEALPQVDQDEVIAQAEEAVAKELYVYVSTDEGEQRVVGDTMALLAQSYMLTRDERYLNRALEWAQLASDSERMPAYGDGKGIAAGTILYGLAIAYDTLYEEIPEPLKTAMREAMLSHGGKLLGSWQSENNYLHNFNYIIAAGLGYSYYAIYDETEGADDFLPTVQRKLACAYAAMGHDGASPEGIGYWSYGLNWLGKCIFLSARMWDFDPVEQVEWITKSVADYRLYMSFPQNGRTARKYVAYFGDCYGYDFCNNNMLYYYIAQKTNAPEITWLARQHRNFGYQTGDSREELLSFYYRARAPEAKSPTELELPTFQHFEDYDMVVARTGWDGDESAVYFKCGANQGRKASYLARAFEDSYDLGAGHSHPDANHFILFGGGAQLLIDDEYTSKRTAQHNTLLVNGKGQIGGGGATWYTPKDRTIVYHLPYIKTAVTETKYDYFVGAAANAYDKSLGVERFDRHMLLIKEKNVLIVADDIKTKEEAELELRFFPRYTNITAIDGGYRVSGANTLFVENLTPEESVLTHTKVKTYSRGESTDETAEAETNVFTVSKSADSMQTVTAFSWCESGGTPCRVSMNEQDGCYVFTIDDQQWILDTQSLKVTVQ